MNYSLDSFTSNRRSFLKTGALAAGGLALPNILRSAHHENSSHNGTLNIACIGIGGKGSSDSAAAAKYGNIVAVCDIDLEGRAAESLENYPKAKRFTDYRVMFDKMAKEIDAVTISVPDHSHFPAAMYAMALGKHVFVQKPLANTIWECRQLLLAARKYGVTTQMGIQGHTFEGQRLLKEWTEAGVIGRPESVRYWTNRPIWPQDEKLKFKTAKKPDHINWNVWKGTTAREQPYSPSLHPFAWRASWDYGCGAMGDIGCHLIDAAFWAFDLDIPNRVEAEMNTPFSDTVAPSNAVIHYQFDSANGKKLKKPFEFLWSDGGLKPKRPDGLPEGQELDRQFGQLIYGTKGQIYSAGGYCESLRLFPESEMQRARDAKPEKKYARVKGGPVKEWIDCIHAGTQPGANFEYASRLTEVVLLGNLAVRLGKPIEWDSKNLKVKGIPEADAMIKREYRKGWEFEEIKA